VHWQTCVARSGSPLVQNIEVMSGHVGMALSSEVYKVIASRLVLVLTSGCNEPRARRLF
jgi:hypothetical protein